jgi:kynurenine formamidase
MSRPELSNWGRWGPDDQLGALNFMTRASIVRAVRLVTKGVVYNLAVPLDKDGPQYPFFHKTWRVTHFTTDERPGAANVADDVVMMEAHSGTHIDALGHYWRDGTMWNGRSSKEVSSLGIGWGGIDNVPGFVSRGVMLDLPRLSGVRHLALGEVVTVEAMEECARMQQTPIQSADVLLLRTGWYTVFKDDRALWDQGEPGPDVSCTAWLREREIIALGADSPAVESADYRHRDPLAPRLHVTALRDLGVYLIENLTLEDLARDQVYEFLFVAAPLRLTKASGAPFTPLAIA